MKNTNILYGIVGLVLGLVIASGYYSYDQGKNNDRGYSMRDGAHKMADGTFMNNNESHMENMMQDMMAALEGKTGDDFDKEFLAEMIVHHQGAVEMARAVLSTSKRPELIKLANEIISAQTKEIGMMGDWQKTWFK